MSQRHSLTFRGEDHAIPCGFGLCTDCGALVTMEQWVDTTCPGRPAEKEENLETR